MTDQDKKNEDQKPVSTSAGEEPKAEGAEVGLESKEESDKEKKAGKKVKAKKGRKKIKRQVSLGRAYIQATYNNTIVTFTDQNGNVLAWSSAGQCGFKGPKKATPYAAGVIAKSLVDKIKELDIKEVDVYVRGVGTGREAAVRALGVNGVQVVSIKDVTPTPHGGCRPKKPRRI